MSAGTPDRRRLLVLSFAALGVVYGDIGTSPLYALRECFHGSHPVEATAANVLGVLSLIFWSLVVVVSVKYLVFVVRADNQGEGGILALMALVCPAHEPSRTTPFTPWLVMLGLFGAALLYGDGIITPAISVLSAVEGLEIAAPVLEPFVVPLTVVLLAGLFLIQRRGTSALGALFGPVTLVWFVTLAALGLRGIVSNPSVLAAVNPLHAFEFFAHNGWTGFQVLGAVFLVVTGGEALYADMGHFGRAPIRLAWFALVLPALLLNYFGQGALLLVDLAAVRNPFYLLAPGWAVYPLIALSTAATSIASQAVISGCFSLTRQAVQLGYCPRVEIVHTSSDEIGQIYVPPVNALLMVSTVALVISFGSSSNLAAAYGMAVTTTMVITSVLFGVATVKLWGWPRWAAVLLSAAFLVLDLGFFGANALKLFEGAWFPLVVAAGLYAVLTTWKDGRARLAERLTERRLSIDLLIADLVANPVPRVQGTAVFMTASPEGVPTPLLHNLKHNKVLHETVVLLTIQAVSVPRVPDSVRLDVHDLGHGFHRIIARGGFMETPNVREILALAGRYGLALDPGQTSFFLGRETLVRAERSALPRWRWRLFSFLSRNAQPPGGFFGIPPNRVVEIGQQVSL